MEYQETRKGIGERRNDNGFNFLYRLQRHPFEVRAWFARSLVVTYALPADSLAPLLSPGLELDEYHGFGFLAVAMVETHNLRPAFLPAFLGRDFFLAGYRIFARFRTPQGRLLRGLKILRSDTNSRLMAGLGNLLTHYRYQLAAVSQKETTDGIELTVRSEDGLGDLEISARTNQPAHALPSQSPFPDFRQARLFAGPMPFTFDYEPQTHSMIVIEGVREEWHPKPIEVNVKKIGFLDQPALREAGPQLASAFVVEKVPYRWKRGVQYPLPAPPFTPTA